MMHTTYLLHVLCESMHAAAHGGRRYHCQCLHMMLGVDRYDNSGPFGDLGIVKATVSSDAIESYLPLETSRGNPLG